MALRTSRWLRVGGCVIVMLLVAGCAGGRRRAPDTEPVGSMMGVYRAHLEDPQGRSRKFRLLLFAALPDRIHGEILSPVGTTELIIDGGGGRVAVTLPRKRVTYAGDADAEALELVLGVSLSLEQLVQALLGNEMTGSGYVLDREPAGETGLPDLLRIEGSGHHLSLRLKSMQPLRASTSTLGNGEPPPNMEVRPLADLDPVDLPDDSPPEGKS